MLRRLILISGGLASGKTTAANGLREEFGAHVISSRHLLLELGGSELDRSALQALGERLDVETNGQWIVERVARIIGELPSTESTVVLDAARDPRQIHGLRALWPNAIVHVHLAAPVEAREARYGARPERGASFADASSHVVEAAVDELARIADVVIDTKQCEPGDVVTRMAAVARLSGDPHAPLVDVIVGAQWGSEGKGQIAAYLAPEYQVLVRVGGPNAGHSVYEEPAIHQFHLLPSGTSRNPDALLVLGPGAVLDTQTLQKEIQTHEVEASRLRIDPGAIVIESQDIQAEADLVKTISSTGQGVGRATVRKILRTAADPKVRRAGDVPELDPYLEPTINVLRRAYRQGHRVMLEGTQGTLLSLHHGSYPYVTSRDTTASGCMAEAGIPPARVRRTVMVVRTYPIRVRNPEGVDGIERTSGPMGREIDWAEISRRSLIPQEELERCELSSTTKKLRRVAEFNWRDVAVAAALNAPTDIALTFVDYLDIANRQAKRFEQLTAETRAFVEELERVAGAPASLLAVHFSHRAIVDRRRW